MQDGVRKLEEMQLDEIEQTLARMIRLEKLVLGMQPKVSMRWPYT